ncbi:MAG TPA: hypothetical protein PKX15_04675 [Bacteroidales bacterium]|nr:hypothetical protein [Bacteroidales bacterium]
MENFQNNNITSSISVETPKLTYDTTGNDRVLAIILKKQEELERELHDLKNKKILEETQLPKGILEQSGHIVPYTKRGKRGRGYRPILRYEIEEAIKHSGFGAQQAKYLGVHIETYKKYAKMYGLWNPQPNLKGKTRNLNPDSGKYPLNRILAGDFNGHPKVTDWMVKRKLLKTNIFPKCCAICGYDKKILGGTYPIILLDHLDGDRKNFKKENLRFLCWNCTVECGRGYWSRKISLFDPQCKPQ